MTLGSQDEKNRHRKASQTKARLFVFRVKMRKSSSMRKYVWSSILLFILTANVFSQKNVAPTFEQYSVTVSQSRPKPIDLNSHKMAHKYRSNLRYQVKDGVNFAGHYVLTKFGCGAACLLGAIVDTKTGRVFFPNEISVFGLQDWDKDIGIRRNSRLLILNEYREGHLIGTHYHLWTGTKFRELNFVPQTRN